MQQIICSNDSPFFQWTTQVPISFTEWKCILSAIPTKDSSKCLSILKKIIIIHLCSIDRLSSSDPICRSSSQLTKSDRQSLPRNQVFGDKVVDSFVTSASNLVQSSITNSRQGIQRRKNQQ